MHAVKRGRLRRADMCADVLDLIPGERAHAPVGIDRRFQCRDAVRRRNRSGEMLDAVFDPFHRPAGDARRDAHEDDVGKDRLLDAEAAAGIRRRAQAQPVARHFQRPRHHRVQAEGALEIGENVVGAFARIVCGDDTVGFDRRARIARVADRNRDARRSFGKRALGIAVAEGAVADEIRPQRLVQRRLSGVERGERIDNGRQRPVIDVDQLERVFREIAVARHHDRDRLADIAHAPDRDRPAFDRRLHADREARRQRLDLGAGDHGGDARGLPRGFNIDCDDFGVRVRRAKNGRVLRARRQADIVDETAAAGEQSKVFDPLDRPANPACWRCRHGVSCGHSCAITAARK